MAVRWFGTRRGPAGGPGSAGPPGPARSGRLVRLLDRVLGPVEAGGGPAGAGRRNPDAVVDCAVYVAGRRQQQAPVHFAEAQARARWRRDAFVWLGLHDPDPHVLADVGRTFGLHELTLAQAHTDGHRPVVARQGELTLLVLRTARYVEHAELTASSEVVDTGDVMVLVGSRFVITVRHGAAGALAEVRAGLQRRSDVLAQGPWAVAHAVCDRIVDSYLEVAGHVEKDLEKLEETAFARECRADVQQFYQLKRELVEFKRAVLPLQAPLRGLLDRDDVPVELRRYFADVVDRLGRAVDRVGGFDELVNSILQARLAQVAVEQNNDMRKIAAWAAIAATQTAVAGVYGMNFAYMPELQWRYGYPVALLVMATASIALYRLFRRSGWL